MKDPNWRKCVLRADSRDIIKRIPDNSIDFILTDPPYNIGQHSTGNIPLPGRTAMNNDVADWDLVEFNPEDWADDFVRILKPNGNLFIFTSYNQIGRWHKCLDHRFDTTNFMIWHKTNPAPKIFKAGFLNSCEMIFTCWNKKHKWNFISQKEMHNFIESPICMKPERLSNPKHPTQKPIAILKKMIQIASNEGDIVFDPFMGVGSVGVAAIELGRRFIGIEIDELYFKAAYNRINDMDNKKNIEIEGLVSDVEIPQQTTLFSLDNFFSNKVDDTYFPQPVTSGLQPIIKWAGGKEKELKYILPNVPMFNKYYEPFVGGGAVFTAIRAKEYYINDLSNELISLYNNIATQKDAFFDYAEAIDCTWHNSEVFFNNHQELINYYLDYRNGTLNKVSLKTSILDFCTNNSAEICEILDQRLRSFKSILPNEIERNLFRKMSRMKELEEKKHKLPDSDIRDNIETAIKSAVYMNFRNLYNSKSISPDNGLIHCALFLYIRNYSYSGMFRYNDKGDFNVPYGGIGYNRKTMSKKLAYYKSKRLLNHFADTRIYNMDFEDFLKTTKPGENDFVFLDPPYDSEFSTYAQNAFTRDDQRRLAEYLINECKAKWMMIIKYTDFIFDLYNKEGINIHTFDKEYLVSFMNRNDKKVTHLLITNY